MCLYYSDAIDIVLLIDTSTISDSDWQYLLQYLSAVLKQFRYTPEGDRVSVVLFSDTAQEVLSYKDYKDEEVLLDEVQLLRPSHGTRY